MEWHKILGHCNLKDVRKLQSVVEGMKITDDKEVDCEVCTEGKMCEFRNRKPDQRATDSLDLVHCDLAGPIDPVARGGFRYALSFVDDYTGIIMVYFLKQKSDTLEATEKFLADVAPFGKVKRITPLGATMELSLQVSISKHCCVRIRLDTRQARRIHRTKTVLSKEHGGVCLAWQDAY